MNLPPQFNQQFFDDDGTPLAGGFLHTYASGTLDDQVTYQDQGGVATNVNPIELDAAGRCDLWLDPSLEYDFVLLRADLTSVRTYESITGAKESNSGVTSWNGLTGVVEATAEDLPFATSTSTTWFVGTDVSAALDAVISHVDASITAASIPIVDAGNLITATNVESALQELAGRTSTGQLLRITKFTGSGTWTKGAGTTSVVVEGVGGGGGGYGTTAGPGGGAGGYFKTRVTAPGATEAVTIGAGGAANTAGGTTSFGSWGSATGGGVSTGTVGGQGGTGTVGDITLKGGSGGWGGAAASDNFWGSGGNSFFGGGAPGNLNNGSFTDAGTAGAANTGGGGSGGSGGATAGGAGIVIVYEYS